MSALGHWRTSHRVRVMSALPPKADIAESDCHVRFVPKADIQILTRIHSVNQAQRRRCTIFAQACRVGSGPPLTRYTPSEINVIAIQSIVEGHSPRTGIARRAVMAGVNATNAAPPVAPRMPTIRP